MEAGAIARAGMAALSGERGHVYDRIVLNAGLIDYWLGFCDDAKESVEAARCVVDDGSALLHLRNYVERSNSVHGSS